MKIKNKKNKQTPKIDDVLTFFFLMNNIISDDNVLEEKNGLISENPEISYIGQKSVILNPYSSAVPQPHRAFPRFALWFRLCSGLGCALPWTLLFAPSCLSKISSDGFPSMELCSLHVPTASVHTST